MKFSEYKINTQLKKNLSKLSFIKPTDIQYKTIPHILRNEDVLAVAQTGTGKTAAYLIPILNIIYALKRKLKRNIGIHTLIMVPTHELAIQVEEVINNLNKSLNINALAIYGGVTQEKQINDLKDGCEIIIATPGRMFDLKSQGFLNLSNVKTLILDEADVMLKKGFLKDIKDVIKFLPKRKQTLFFSATINKEIKKQAYQIIQKNAIRIQISPKNPVAKNVFHQATFVEMDDKRFFLERIVRENPSAKIITFVRTKVRAERVKKAMQRVSIKSHTIHSDKNQKERNEVLSKFKTGAIKLLIATDVSARGVDIPDVDIVVNYDIPDIAENYVHRVGRTGRGKKKGYAISFYSSVETELLDDVEMYLGGEIQKVEIDDHEYQITLEFSKDSRGIDWKQLTEKAINDNNGKKKQANKKKKSK